jgi:hypothetical protein
MNKYSKHKVVVYWVREGIPDHLVSCKSFDKKKDGKEHLKEVLSDYIDSPAYAPYRIVFLRQYRPKNGGKMKSKIHSEHLIKA